jgi:hypothetical protein
LNVTPLDAIAKAFDSGKAIPFLGPGVLSFDKEGGQLPDSHIALVGHLTSKSSVPHKVRNNLGAAAQFIENFKHRSTVTNAMTEAFSADAQPTSLHRLLMSLPALPLVVHAWYDDLPQKALRSRTSWGMAQGVSQSEHFGDWIYYYNSDGTYAGVEAGRGYVDWKTMLYQPFGSVWPAHNYLVSDSDFVEVITEIDIQTPIPDSVQEIRKERNFLFLGCRFSTQLERLFAHQIIKRSSDKHWAILPDEPTRNEARFLEEHNIERIAISLDEFVSELTTKLQAA